MGPWTCGKFCALKPEILFYSAVYLLPKLQLLQDFLTHLLSLPLTKTASDPEGMPLLIFITRRFPVQVCLPIFQLFVYSINSKKCCMSTLCQVSLTDTTCEQLLGRETAPGSSTGLTSQDQHLHSGSWCLLSEAKPGTTDIATIWISSFSCCSEKIPGTGDSRNQWDF